MTTLQRAAPPLPDEACRACLVQVRGGTDTDEAPPHRRLMITSSTPIVEAFGGGVQTRYVCLDCGHSLTHSTGRFGQGWR